MNVANNDSNESTCRCLLIFFVQISSYIGVFNRNGSIVIYNKDNENKLYEIVLLLSNIILIVLNIKLKYTSLFLQH